MPLFFRYTFVAMKTNRYFLLALICMSLTSAGAQSRRMTIDEVDSITAHQSLRLKASLLEIDAAKGQLKQAKAYENPEVQLTHNVQNPTNRKWFDTGHDGQTDIQVSQPIAIGGQHKNKVRLAEATLKASKAAHDAAMLDVRCEARTTFIELYNAQQKLKVYDKEITSTKKIYDTYSDQTDKGNVSKMETFRIAAMLNQLRAEKAELQLYINELQMQLCLLLDIPGVEPIETLMDEETEIRSIIDNLAKLQSLVAPGNTDILQDIVQNHPEIIQAKYQEDSAIHAIKAEKSEALPRIALNGEWDKNGSIGHNFFAVGATLSVPLWNRNKGNIRSAKAKHKQAAIERQQKENELQASLLTHYRATILNLKLIEEQKQQMSTDLEMLLEAAEQQFIKRNISVIEFVDLYSSYRDTKFQMEDAKAQLLKSNEELKKYTR